MRRDANGHRRGQWESESQVVSTISVTRFAAEAWLQSFKIPGREWRLWFGARCIGTREQLARARGKWAIARVVGFSRIRIAQARQQTLCLMIVERMLAAVG